MTALSDLRLATRELVGGMAFDLTFWPGGSWDWTDAALNWGAGQVAKLLGLTYVTAPATVTSKKAPIPADAVSVVNCIGGRLGMGKVLMESTFQTEDMKNPNWRSRQGEPSVWIQQDGATILLNGDPSTGAILVGYIQIPTPMVEPADEPDPRIPPEFHQHLRYAAAAYLYQISTKVKNLEMASKMFAIFTTELGLGPLPLAQISVQR